MRCIRVVYFVSVQFLLIGSACFAQQATVTWQSVQTGQALPSGLLLGGRDGDLNANLYVCRVNLNGGIHPGKLLNGYCNVSFGNKGTQYQDYEVAIISGGSGHWGPWNPADKPNMLVGGNESDGTPLYICRTGYHNGLHPGKLVPAGTCDFEWGGAEYASAVGNEQVFYLTPGPAVVAPRIQQSQVIKSFHINVNASSSKWTNAVVLAQNQSATISVPRRPDGRPQTWGVIDPQHRGENDITGNGVNAGHNFILPNGREGSLLLRDGNGSPRQFTSVDQKITIAGPGQISLIANDEGACNSAPCHPLICFGCGPGKDGFTDNRGWMEVEIVITSP